MRPHNPATGLWPPSAIVVSAEPFSHGTGTMRCPQKEMVTYLHWSVSLWRDPDDVSHCWILSPDKTEWRLISATLCRWRCCFVADQLWFMTRIREEEECTATTAYIVSHCNWWWQAVSVHFIDAAWSEHSAWRYRLSHAKRPSAAAGASYLLSTVGSHEIWNPAQCCRCGYSDCLM